MGDLFGTDGVRGIPGEPPLLPETVRRLAFVAARLLIERQGAHGRNGSAPLILMGRDPRPSGPALGRALAQGFTRAGCRVVDLGIVPTPALAYLAPRRGALAAVVISASHNPPEFNGIKFFTGDGFKMGPDLEGTIERRLETARDPGPCRPRVERDLSGVEDYLEFLRSTFPAHLDLSGLRLVVDAGNGSASLVGPRLLRALGAEVFAVGCSPRGNNINQGCGALDTALMRREVVRRRAHAGVSFDGDADRALFADEKGALLDGDAVMAMIAMDLHEKRVLRGSKVVVTVMSNFGLMQFLRDRGIEPVTVPVGDRNVTETIEQEGLSLGGENSGHIVFRRYGPTGDGLLTALQVLGLLRGWGRPLGWFRGVYRPYPQILENVRVARRVPLQDLPVMRRRIRECEARLKGKGRVFVRYSGTEPLLRVLVEGPDRAVLERLAAELVAVFRKEVAAADGSERSHH